MNTLRRTAKTALTLITLFFIFTLAALTLAACGRGSDSAPTERQPSVSFTAIELLDPVPATDNRFGSRVVILANGNIVVSSPGDSSVAPSGGAVHLYDAKTKTLIASIHGDSEDDDLGSDGITELATGNFVIASSNDDVGGVFDAGSVRLVNGTTGIQIGSAIAGDMPFDGLGFKGVTALANGNFVIVSPFDDEAGVAGAGSVRLVNGTTGIQIGNAILGDTQADLLGSNGVIELANGRFVIASPSDDVAGVIDAGSVKLVNGTTGIPIGSPIAGDTLNDSLGSNGVTALTNGNFVIVSRVDDVAGVVNAGSVKLVSGKTGNLISTFAGNTRNDSLGSSGIIVLDNGNFLIASSSEDVGGVVEAGSARLVDGTTGIQINGVMAGSTPGEGLGSRITTVANGNFVIASPGADVGGAVDVGAVRLLDSATGNIIGGPIAGDTSGDRLGSHGLTALANGNFVIVSSNDDVSGVVDAGSVRLVDGATGNPIGNPIAGNTLSDTFGSNSVVALPNGNFVIASPDDDVGGVVDAGSVRLVSGTTGIQIGRAIVGNTLEDHLGSDGTTALINGNFVIASPQDDVNGVVDAGSVKLVSGKTGVQIGNAITGNSLSVIGSTTSDYFILRNSFADNNGLVKSGRVLLVE